MQNEVYADITAGVFNGKINDMLVYNTFVGKNNYNKVLFTKIEDNSPATKGVTETEFKRIGIKYTEGMKISDSDSLYSLVMYAAENLIPKLSFTTDEHINNVYNIYFQRWISEFCTNTDSHIYNTNEECSIDVSLDYELSYEVERMYLATDTSVKISNRAVKYKKMIDTILDDIITDKMTEKQKITTVHNYMINKYSYDYSLGADSFEFYGALDNKKAVCQGFATLFKVFMAAEGIECELKPGMASSGPGKSDYEYHMWNRVKVDGKWLYVDVTFDEGLGSNTFLLLDEESFYGKGYHL